MHDPGHGTTRRRVWRALIFVLAANYLALGITAAGQARLLAIGGGVLIVAAFIAATAGTPRLTVALAVLGATPLAITTWWSIVTPVLATVTIAVTLAARPHTGHRLLPDHRNPANRHREAGRWFSRSLGRHRPGAGRAGRRPCADPAWWGPTRRPGR
jgi:hypothetical protein